ncbi:hypothetical protein ACFQJ7_15810 [Halovenus rubra]|uniref:Uncharacterized protein n=2 Tax=Halovenus rubra TaxID=869890 RepID=A0ACC7E0P3_9EURY|nr:hypothetical protein [Halovenus rubra]
MMYGVPTAVSSAREAVIGSDDQTNVRAMGLFNTAMRTGCCRHTRSWAARSDGANAIIGQIMPNKAGRRRQYGSEREYPRPTGERPQH